MMNDDFITKKVLVHTPTLQYAHKFTGDQTDAQDLLQNTLVKVLRYHKSYVNGTNLLGWIYTIMRNTFINDCRKKTLEINYKKVIGEGGASYLNSTKNRIEGQLIHEDIHTVMESIPEMYYKPFMMYFEGYKYYEIAEFLEVPEGTVKTRIHTARKLLKKKLGSYRYSS